MVYFVIFLRIVHIFAGVFWVGGSFVNFAFVAPTARSVAQEDPQASQKFVQGLMVRRRLTVALTVASGLTMLAGILLYGIDSGGFRLSWITSGVGLGFTTGALAAVASAILGRAVIVPAVARLGALGAAIQQAGGPPTAAQQAEMSQLNARMNSIGRVNVALLMIALLGMSVARYLAF